MRALPSTNAIAKGAGPSPPSSQVSGLVGAVVGPALVSAEQFDLVARRLAANQRAARRTTSAPTCFAGSLSYGICRSSCSGSPAPPAIPLNQRSGLGKVVLLSD
jgi:hypothetical protein